MKKWICGGLAVLMLAGAFVSCKTNPGNGFESGTQATEEQQAKITKITVDGEEQDLRMHEILYPLSEDAWKIPKVKAEASGGTGELTVTQATDVPGSATVELNGERYMITFVPEKDYQESAFQNTFYCLKVKKKLNVAFFGGSITDGAFADPYWTNCYRALTTQWLGSSFPEATVSESNAAIGGTGSFWGSYRATEALKLESEYGKPDLVFIEFAVNDGYDRMTHDQVLRNGESIIHQIYDACPKADIVILITTNSGLNDNSDACVTAWREIAAAYGLPIIAIGKRLKDEIGQNGTTWETYFGSDSVHPNNAGHRKYADYIAEVLKAELLDKHVSPFRYIEHNLPERNLSAEALATGATYYNAHDFFLPSGSGFVKYGNSGERVDYGIKATAEGATLSFTFTGTGVWLDLGMLETAGVLSYTVDGKSYDAVDVRNTLAVKLATGLAEGKHTVTLTLQKSGTRQDIQIRRIMTEGDATRAGIQIQK